MANWSKMKRRLLVGSLSGANFDIRLGFINFLKRTCPIISPIWTPHYFNKIVQECRGATVLFTSTILANTWRMSVITSVYRKLIFWDGNSEILLAAERHPSTEARNYSAAQIWADYAYAYYMCVFCISTYVNMCTYAHIDTHVCLCYSVP